MSATMVFAPWRRCASVSSRTWRASGSLRAASRSASWTGATWRERSAETPQSPSMYSRTVPSPGARPLDQRHRLALGPGRATERGGVGLPDQRGLAADRGEHGRAPDAGLGGSRSGDR
jgi:hypothetical protein